MLKRRISRDIEERLNEAPAVALLGPRQGGKTTLALELASRRPSIYLDLESPRDLAKLADPELYLRDSGVVHALLGLADMEAVLGHPVAGGSWEGFVIESLLAASPRGTDAHFYRTSAGAEIDLLLTMPGGDIWAIEIKRSVSPSVRKGFHIACDDISPARRLVVYAGDEQHPIGKGVEAIGLVALAELLAVQRAV